MPRFGIRARMIAIVALPTLLVYLGVLGLALIRLTESNRVDVTRIMKDRAVNYADRFDGAFERAAAIARTTASLMENVPEITEAQIYAQLRSNVLQDEAVYGAAMAFAPGTFKHDDSLFSPYVFRGVGGIEQMNIDRSVYDWYSDPAWQWWDVPWKTKAPAWTDPYFDKGAGNVLMVTYSVPFKRDGVYRGVTTVDIKISKIRERVGASIVGDTDFILLTRDGQFVSSPREQDVMTGRTVVEVMSSVGRSDIADAAREAMNGRSGVTTVSAWEGSPPPGWERWRERSWLFYAPVRSTGWTFAAMVPESVALGPARERVTEAGVALAITLALLIACIVLVSTLVTRPIARMAAAVRRMASGDLDHRVEVSSRDEIGALGHDINGMARDLKHYAEETARTRARSREAMIFALAKLAESRDDDTGKHLERICLYADVLARELSRRDPALDEEWIHTVATTAALHDIGKVGIPDAILKKPGKLTDDERHRMQSHTTIGGDTLIAVRQEWRGDDFLRTAVEIALGHHEKWDGSGYPYGLAAEDISLAARIVAVADVYDALTSKRVYKPAMTHDEAKRIIVEGRDRHFDPRVIEAFLAVEGRFREIADQYRNEPAPAGTGERPGAGEPPRASESAE